MNKTQMATDVFNKYAVDYQTRFMDLSGYADTFDFFCSRVPEAGAAILDVACGPGNVSRYLLNKRPDYKVLGTDLATNMLELARKNNPAAEYRLLDTRSITDLNQKFNGILCGFGLPYLSKEETVRFIYDAASLLLPGGVLYISTMEGAYSKSGVKSSSTDPEAKTYTHYHEFEYLSTAFAECGFDLPGVWRKDFQEKDGTTTTDLVMVAGLRSCSDTAPSAAGN